MQTFLPWPSFPHSAAVLDRARLGKQRIENVQLLRTLVGTEETPLPGDMPEDLVQMIGQRRNWGWRNHPATRQWRGFRPALALYATFIIREWIARGYNNSLAPPYDENWEPNPDCGYAGPLPKVEEVEMPSWLGDTVYHATHRSNLVRKDPTWYGQFGWREGPGLQYVWPENLAYEQN